MKRCPRCSQVYSDEMAFCLADGTPLAPGSDEPEEPTVVRSSRSTSPTPAVAGPGFGSIIKYLAAGVLLLIILLVLGAAFLWIFWPRDRTIIAANNISTTNSDAVTPTRTPISTPTSTPFVPVRETPIRDDRKNDLETQQAELERERQRLAEERRRLEEQKQNSLGTTRTVPPSFVDPGTTRITFRRGSVGETVSGTIGNSRSFVLRTLGGQYLSATVRSAGGCVVFSGGGANTGFVTGSGDSYLYLRNTCGSPARFSLTVVVR